MKQRAVIFIILSCLGLQGADWNQWRGPGRDGVTNHQLPAKLPDKLTQVWQLEVGTGHSSPLVVGDHLILFSRTDNKETLRRIDAAKGAIIWETSYAAPYEMHGAATGHGKGPKSTPLIAGDAIYTLGIDGIVSAHALKDGKQLWQKNYGSEFPKTSPLYGAAMSPLAWNDGVVVHVGGQDKGALLMLDGKSGKERWRWAGDGPGYASPVLMAAAGSKQLITQSQGHLIGIDSTGKLLWKRALKTPYDQNSVTPLIVGDLLVYSGLDAGSFGLRPGSGDPEVVWQNKRAFSYMSSPVVIGNHIISHSPMRKGMFVCQNAATGKQLWESEGREGENAALLVAGKRVLALTTDARLVIFQASSDAYHPEKIYEDVAASPTWAHPALTAGGNLIVKDKEHLTLYRF